MRNTRRLMRLPLTVLAAAGLILASTPDVATTVAAQAQVASDASKDAQTQTTTPTSDPTPTTTNTPAARAPLAVPLQDAGAGTNLDLGITIESDGTPDFNGDDTAGNDSGANNGIVRVNDTVTYRVQFSVNGTVGTNTTFRMTLPKGMEMTAVPGFCQAGSTLTPPTAGEPTLPLSADSVNQLSEQTLECNLGSRENATDSVSVTARVSNLVHQGQKLAPVSAEISADGVAPVSVPQAKLPEVTASARLMWDISKNSVALTEDSGYRYGPATEPCPWDTKQVCKRTGYTLLMSAPAGGKGAMPAIGDITVVDDLSFASMYPDATPEQISAMNAAPEKYGSRIYPESYFYNAPGNKIGTTVNGVALTEKNSVRDAGTLTFDSTLVGKPVPMRITGADMTLRTYPTQVSRPQGTAIPGNKAYAVAQSFSVFTPVDVLTDFGVQNQAKNTWTLKTVNRYKDLSINGFTASDHQDSASQDQSNDYRTTTPDVSLGARMNKVFTGVPGEAGNMSPDEFSPGYAARGEGPTGGATLHSGGITVAPTQDVLSQIEVTGSTPDLPADVSMVLCDAWDNSRLHLHARDVPASTVRDTDLQSIPSNGAPVWVSGYNNAADGSKSRWATNSGETPALKVQYSTVKGGSGTDSACGDDKGPWYDDPAAVPGNDKALLAQGVYSAVSRVRIHAVLPPPVDNSPAVGGGVRMALSINHRVVDSGRDTGDILPNWASIKYVLRKNTDMQGVLADSGLWGISDYNPDSHTGAPGDRLILALAQARVDKQVRKGETGEFSDTPPQVSGGDAGAQPPIPADNVQYRIVPSLTSGASTRNILKDVWVEDCLPSSQMYVKASREPDVMSVGSTPDDKKRPACGPNETYIRWVYPKHEVNTAIDPIILTAEVSPGATSGVYNNVVQVWAEDDASPAAVRTNDAQVQISNIAGIKLQKEALTPVVQVNRPGQATNERNKWRIQLYNTLPPAQASLVSNPDIIDVLPQNNVAGTSFNGTFTFDAAEVKNGNKPGQEVRILYTNAAAVQLDPRDASNQADGTTTWCDKAEGGTVVSGSGTCPASPSEVTALRVQRPGAYNTGEVIEVELTMVGVDNAGGDTYVNRVLARADGFQFVVGPIARAEHAIESSVGDYTWWDINRNGVQDAGEPAAADVPVQLEGIDDLGNKVSVSTHTNAQGLYSFPHLRSSNADGYVVTFNKDTPRTLTFTTKGTNAQDPATDSNADPATGAADPVVLAKDTNNTTIDAGFIADGSLVVTKMLEGPGANFAHGNTLEFQVRCTADGKTVKEETVKLTAERGKTQLNSAPITGIPVGASCTVTETKAGGADPTNTGDLPSTTVEIGLDAQRGTGAQMTAVLTNRYSAGVVTIAKKIVGEPAAVAAAQQKHFTFDVTCQLPGQGGAEPLTVLKKNVTVTGEAAVPVPGDDGGPAKLPVGARCFATETDNGGANSVDIDFNSYDKAALVTASAADEPAQLTITATNTFTVPRGEFIVSKTVVAGGSTGNETFPVNYTCSAAGQAIDSDDEVAATGTITVTAGKDTKVGRFPVGTTCEITSEDNKAAQRAGYSVNVQLGEKVEIARPSSRVEVTNTYSRDLGSFTVAKKLTGDDVDAARATTFTVHYVCGEQNGDLKVPGDGTAVAGPKMPTGTQCQLSEDEKSAQRDGYSVAGNFDHPTFTIGAKDSVSAVTLTNNYKRHKGGFTLAKSVTGNAAALAGKSFDFTYTCTGLGEKEHTVKVVPGTVTEVTDIPTGRCTITESDAPVDNADYTTSLSVNGATPVTGRSVTIDVANAATVQVTAVNEYTAHNGSFEIVKKVEPATGESINIPEDKTFDFTYTCEPAYEGAAHPSGTLTVRADGKAVSSPQLPVGTSCTIAEDAASAKEHGYEVITPQPVSVTISKKVITVEATNTYKRLIPPPTTSVPPTTPRETPPETPRRPRGTVTKPVPVPSTTPVTPAVGTTVVMPPGKPQQPGGQAPEKPHRALAKTGLSKQWPVIVMGAGLLIVAGVGCVVVARRKR
ncbi:DUF5979 domain-containing protein [Corynebacterium durum]|uniref:DUF5979 domain-containing protein n=1 Tax=Corynebacterium durum TaxID=61592 RepID=UPI0026DD0F76|nr:DUF5979 domain-containing protein [Corynebacterium durum]MDO4651222.1 DUF5979 domain-containing protein [Corynebacterium durum]